MDAILTNTKAWVSGLAEARSVLDIVFIRGITKNEPTFRYSPSRVRKTPHRQAFHRLCSPRRASARTRSRRLSVRACGPRMIGSLRAFRPSLGAIRSASYSRAPAAGSRCRASSSPRSRSRGARRRSRAGSRSPDGSACPRRRSGNGRIARGSEASSTAIDQAATPGCCWAEASTRLTRSSVGGYCAGLQRARSRPPRCGTCDRDHGGARADLIGYPIKKPNLQTAHLYAAETKPKL